MLRLNVHDDQGNKIYFDVLRELAGSIDYKIGEMTPRQKNISMKWTAGYARMIKTAIAILAAAAPSETPNPDEVNDLDFVGIGFAGGVAAALEAIKAQHPDLDLSTIKPDQLREQWAESQSGYAKLLDFNRHHDGAFTITHGWAFRLLATNFVSYLRSLDTHNYVAQTINIRSALTAPVIVPEMVVITCTYDWWKRAKGAIDAAAQTQDSTEEE